MRIVLLTVLLSGGVWIAWGQRGAAEAPDAVTADPAHYSVSFENDVVRLLRVRYGPGEGSIMHSHPASCTVFLTDQTFEFTLPDGSTAPASVEAGQLGCGNANVHLPRNLEDFTAEFIMVEFKGRQTFR